VADDALSVVGGHSKRGGRRS